ncbi:MAG: PAS domain S-box protein [Nitrospirota bacterium]|nr:PAS domain S-box protein [Nitrospirota bacterium]
MQQNEQSDIMRQRIRSLRESADFLSAVFESLVGYAIIAADFDGNILAYNEGAHQIYGYAPEEVIGRNSIELFVPRDATGPGMLQDVIRELLSRGRYSYEGERIRKDGSAFPADVLATLTRDNNGQFIGFVELVRDLSEQKKMEALQVREKTERIEQLEEELRSLAGLSNLPQTSVTARMYGVMTLLEGAPDIFQELAGRYKELMDLALEQRLFKVKHDISGPLRAISETLGFYRAGPRDVVDIHAAALKEKIRTAESSEKKKAYTGEGWIMVLELMGDLASFYRNRAQRAASPAGEDADMTKS